MTVNYDGQKIVISSKLTAAQIPAAVIASMFPLFGVAFGVLTLPNLGEEAGFFRVFSVAFLVVWEFLALFGCCRFWSNYLFRLTLDSSGIHRSSALPLLGMMDISWHDLYAWGVHAEYPKNAMNNTYHEPQKTLFFKGQTRIEKAGSIKTATSEIKLSAAGAVRQDCRIIADFVSRYSSVGPDGISL